MSYYNLIKENYKFFRKQLEKESEKESEKQSENQLDIELETESDTNLDINNEIPPNENLNGGSKSIKYQVIDIDWDDLLNENDEDIFLYSVSKDIEFNNKKIKEPTKEEVYDELLNNQQIEYSFTGEMDEIDDQNIDENIDENIDQDINGINTIKETDIENILSNEAEKEFDENIEDYEDGISDSDDADDFDDTIIKEYFNKNESVSTLETNDETDLADIDNIINNYFESFENVQGGRSIDKIKEILADDTEYKNSLNLTGGNFKPIKKTKINRLYPYN